MKGHVRLFATGDSIMLRPRSALAGSDFEPLLQLQKSCDVAVTNCEMVLSARGKLEPKDLCWSGPQQARELAGIGINLVTLANNHVMDLGTRGLLDTLKALEQNGIDLCGAGINDEDAMKPAVAEHNGVRVAFLAFLCIESKSVLASAATAITPGVAIVKAYPVCRLGPDGRLHELSAADESDVRRMEGVIREARRKADIVVVSLHMHMGYPHSTDYGRPVAQAAIEAGAQLVLAHGSHVIEPVERYRGSLIFYGLGNFFFQLFENNQVIPSIGSSWAYRKLLYSFTTSSDYWEGLAIRAELHDERVSRVEVFPLELSRDGNPRLAMPHAATQILEELQERSSHLGAELTLHDGYAEVR